MQAPEIREDVKANFLVCLANLILLNVGTDISNILYI